MKSESESVEQEEQPRSSIWLPVILVLMVLAIWIAVPFLITGRFSNWSERGQFGDLFGSVNALFSGLAFAGLFYTIHLQRQELALQRQELRLQRQEMAGSREHLAAQARAQDNLFRATIGQIKVAALQARIEASKLENGPVSGNMNVLADSISIVATDVEKMAMLANYGIPQ